MNRSETEDFLANLAAMTPAGLIPGMVEDSKRLLDLLPDWGIEGSAVFSVGVPPEGDRITFFWSRSANAMNPGNRTTRVESLGDGMFRVVEGSGDPQAFEPVQLGAVPIRALVLSHPGTPELVQRMVAWQTGGPPP